jgi:hypothetical protein
VNEPLSDPDPAAAPVGGDVVADFIHEIYNSMLLEFQRRYCVLMAAPGFLRGQGSQPECHNAAVARERQRREAEEQRIADLNAALAEATTDWAYVRILACCDAWRAVPALDLHRPTHEYDGIVCQHCEEADGLEGTQQVAWPCPTYVAIKGAT